MLSICAVLGLLSLLAALGRDVQAQEAAVEDLLVITAASVHAERGTMDVQLDADVSLSARNGTDESAATSGRGADGSGVWTRRLAAVVFKETPVLAAFAGHMLPGDLMLEVTATFRTQDVRLSPVASLPPILTGAFEPGDCGALLKPTGACKDTRPPFALCCLGVGGRRPPGQHCLRADATEEQRGGYDVFTVPPSNAVRASFHVRLTLGDDVLLDETLAVTDRTAEVHVPAGGPDSQHMVFVRVRDIDMPRPTLARARRGDWFWTQASAVDGLMSHAECMTPDADGAFPVWCAHPVHCNEDTAHYTPEDLDSIFTPLDETGASDFVFTVTPLDGVTATDDASGQAPVSPFPPPPLVFARLGTPQRPAGHINVLLADLPLVQTDEE